MIKHIINYNESLLPKEHKRIIVEARRELSNMIAPLLVQYHYPEITAVWELVTSDQHEYTILIKDIYSNIPELTCQLLQYLDHPLMGYLTLPKFPPLESILKETSCKSLENK